jgi:putative aldouronate transport system permease protein
MWLFVFGMILNVGIVPWYLTISGYKLLDSIWALVLPGAVPIWSVIILMNFFRSIPKELDEAARMDGANPVATAVEHLPADVAARALATITLFSIVGHWNSFFDGLILMNDPDQLPAADLHPAVGDRRPARRCTAGRRRCWPNSPATRSTRPSSSWR